jgi:hypothetical protein
MCNKFTYIFQKKDIYVYIFSEKIPDILFNILTNVYISLNLPVSDLAQPGLNT